MIGGISGVGTYGLSGVGSYYRSRLAENAQSAQTAQTARLTMGVRKAASPETPVEPVRSIRPVSREDVSVPDLTSRLENDPAAMAGRMRTRYGDVDKNGFFVETGKNGLRGAELSTLEGKLSRAEDALARNDLKNAEDILNKGALPDQKDAVPDLPGAEKKEIPGEAVGAESVQKALEEGECKTCEERKYQDGSDDMGVSFQTPTNIKPEQAASAVRGHEMEHVYREQAKADREGRKVVSQNVTMHTEICPECGKAYVSGGTTRTVTKADTDNDAQQDLARQSDEQQKTRTPFSAVA